MVPRYIPVKFFQADPDTFPAKDPKKGFSLINR